MSFRIVEEPSRQAPGRAVRRFLRYSLGVLFVLASFVAFAPAMLFVAAVLVFSISEGRLSLDTPEADLALFLGGSTLIAFVLWRLGVRLVRGRRRLVLFLRRFGLDEATAAATFAVGTSAGRSWRLVTLDDDEVAPVGVPSRSRWVVRIARFAAVAVCVAAVWQAISWLSGGGVERAIDEIFESARDRAVEEGESELGAAVGALFAAMVGGIVVVTVTLLALLVPVAVAGSATFFLSVGSRSVRRADRAKALRILRGGEVERSVRKIRSRVLKVFAPRMTVVRAANAVWRDVVLRLARLSAAVVVDVSEPSENLLWEIRMLEDGRTRWIAIGDRSRLAELQHDASAAARDLRRLLDGREVLAYESQRLKPFAASLRQALEAAA